MDLATQLESDEDWKQFQMGLESHDYSVSVHLECLGAL